MTSSYFPAPSEFADDDIVAIGGPLSIDVLIEAYEKGVFPWPIEDMPLTWFSPLNRAILDFKDLHISKSLEKLKNKGPYRFTLNQAFEEVINQCSKVKRQDKGTWITPEIVQAYSNLHKHHYAHSIEVWENNDLVGGIYGVAIKGVFSAESMFHLKNNTSKLALIYLIETLKKSKVNWLDIQILTPHMETFGSKLIPRQNFLEKIQQTHALNLKIF